MYVLGIGAANVDVHGMSRAAIVMRDSNPGHLRTSAGGVTRNIMENLARLGVDARMVSAQGDDLFGEYVRSESEKAGLDMSECLVLPGVNSSSYVSILDERAVPGGRYYEAMTAALPELPTTRSVQDVEQFIRTVKPEQYFREVSA